MKSKLTILCITAVLSLCSQKLISQNLVFISTKNLQAKAYITSEEATKNKKAITNNVVLSEGDYGFNNGNKEILVTIRDGYYTECYGNNEFIRAKLKWISKYEFNLIITEINKKGLPFLPGTLLNTKIFKVRGNKYFYKSNLEGLTWTGKFIKK